MNVLSLFDGISCGRIALERAGIPVERYYSSEIDKNAIMITQKNYPDTIQVGDVTELDFSPFKGKIDLLIGGFPCQDLSICTIGRKGLNGSRSSLFYTLVNAIQIVKPKFFFVENVANMGIDAKREITERLGVEPVEINSALVSAQQRKRLYWTNIPHPVFEDKGILVKDILEKETAGYTVRNDVVYNGRPVDSCKPNLIGKCISGKTGKISNGMSYRVYSVEGKSVTMMAGGGGMGAKTGLYKVGDIVRRLTPVEAERCQTIPDNYTSGLSDGVRYRLVGNAWTVDVIVGFFKKLNVVG